MKSETPVVIFDIGAILIGLNYGTTNSFFEEGARIAKVPQPEFKAWYSALEKRCLLGGVDAKGFFEQLKQQLEQPVSQEELEELVGLLWTGQIEPIVRIKRKIHEKGYGIGLLSNMTEYALDITLRKYPEVYETWGGFKAFSFEFGAIKPNIRIYNAFESLPGPKIFIDDNLSYAKTPAEKLGWYGINHIEFVDAHESIRSLQTPSTITESVKNLFVTRNHKELVQALEKLGVKL